jgi:general nucleoside transport system ATP-binding protein
MGTAVPLIAAEGIVKAFPGVVANDHVGFAVLPGEIHALLGENGAGKSTLAAVLTGLYRPDAGRVLIEGRPVAVRSPRQGLALGIGMVHQHFRLVPRMTVAENVLLGDPRQPRLLRTGRVERQVAELAERYGLDVHPSARVGDLTVGERQRVEIVKTLYRGARVLLLDEPTAVLTPQESQALFTTVRAMAAEGKGVVFISHKLREVQAVSDRVTVLRDGRVIGRVRTADTDRHELARMMVGREVDLSPRRAASPPGEVVLQVDGVSAGAGGTRGRLDGVSLTVRRGEILGIAGVAGNGQRTLAEVVAGLLAPATGTVRIAGTDATGRGPRAARAAGLAYAPEDRNGTGLAPSLSLAENMVLPRGRGLLVRMGRARAAAREAIETYQIKAPGPDAATRTLSGGNVQKVLLARELAADPAVLVVCSPTWGLDVGAVEFVRGRLDRLRADGAGVLLISEDLDEVRALSDRICVLHEGRIVLETAGEGADVARLGLAMMGDRS